ncbi:MAG TPA: enterotoxin [Rhodanobacteraceae bacterium]
MRSTAAPNSNHGVKAWLRLSTLFTACVIAGTTTACAANAGAAKVTTLGNASIGAQWQVVDGLLSHLVVTDKINHVTIDVTAPFKLTLNSGKMLDIKNMRLTVAPHAVALKADPDAARLSARLPGKAVEASFGSPNGDVAITWRLVQRKGSHYLREVVTIAAPKADAPIKQVDLFDLRARNVMVDGTVDGSPVVSGNDWFGFEQPMSHADAWSGRVRLWMDRTLPLKKGKSVTYSAVIGAAQPTQLRRDFAKYVERERAHPYRPFLHYESWYDLGYFTPYTQAGVLNRINTFGEELAVKRHVKIDSFVLDDGWDDYSGAWNFSKNFPHGFVPIAKAAKKYGATIGAWLSPWGGYGKPHDERIKNGRKLGYGIVNDGLALSAPKYWKRFHHVVMDLLDHNGVREFKFDGTGNVNSVYPGSKFDSDFAAAIQLIEDIRADKPDTFINLTTGTWASPFWLRYADSIWRGGYDHNFSGVGSKREQWITYRDEQTYRNIVEKGPLFPLNSLMLHGIIYATQAHGLNTPAGQDFTHGVHSFFATGTDLQGLLISPSLMSSHDWDVVAQAANWARANAKVLEDTHWIGGDPGRLQVYGWAAWTPKKAIITWRNPGDKPQLAVVNLTKQLELPPGAASHFTVKDVWQSGGKDVPATLSAADLSTIKLQPFEVLTLELTPTTGR